MRENVKEFSYVNESFLLFVKVTTCAAILVLAYFFETNFFIQLFVYLFLLIQMQKTLVAGFEALGRFEPDITSLLLVSAFFSLLQGLSSFDARNSFAFCATAFAIFLAGENFTKRYKKDSYYSFYSKASSALILIALSVTVILTVINLFLKVPITNVFKRVLLVPVYICPVSLIAVKLVTLLIFEKLLKDKCATVCDADSIEKIGKAKEMIIEQKGFLTRKEYSLYDIYSVNGDKTGLLSVAMAIESHFTHPFSYAIASASLCAEVPRLIAEDCAEICGKGVCGRVLNDKYFLGNKKLMRDKKITLPDAVSAIDFGDKTPIFVAKNGEFAGFLLLYNKISDGAIDALELIKQLGVRRLLLSDGKFFELKKYADIFLASREKVLQELKKGAKIKAITVTEKPIANADVTVISSSVYFDSADVYVDSLASASAVIAYGKKIYSLAKKTVLVSFMISATFSVLSAFGALYNPLILSALTALPLVLLISAFKYVLPQFSSMEEDSMFGKINYTMIVQGMSCTHCSARVKTALESLKGVSADVSLEEKTVRIKCPASTTAETLAKAVTDVGFTVVSTERV